MKWAVLLLSVFLLSGCASSGFGTCALHTSLSCSLQSVGACQVPTDGDWKGWGICLASASAVRCPSGLAQCAVSAMIRSHGRNVVGGGAGCDTEAARACAEAANPETEEEAITMVADCFREICGGE
mgnify:CR=1 FL=1